MKNETQNIWTHIEGLLADDPVMLEMFKQETKEINTEYANAQEEGFKRFTMLTMSGHEIDALQLEVAALRAELDRLKTEIERLEGVIEYYDNERRGRVGAEDDDNFTAHKADIYGGL